MAPWSDETLVKVAIEKGTNYEGIADNYGVILSPLNDAFKYCMLNIIAI